MTGFVDAQGHIAPDQLQATVQRMADTLIHRGPDDAGVWTDVDRGVALGHRRLAVIDLSQAGHQPMVSGSGRLVIAFNGEIYNHRDLRRELMREGVGFRGTSDTEVVVEAFDRWGIQPTLERMLGMFAIAVWDRHANGLTLIRDRIGIKPMYWGMVGETLLFGSELKALTAYPHWQPTLDRDAIASFLRHNYIQGPRSIYQGINKLQPGSCLRFRQGETPRCDTYWDLRQVASQAIVSRSSISESEAEGALDELLRDAIARHMVADVPVGTLLSGGIDSSLVTALAQTQSSRAVQTFSIGFREEAFNEAPHAASVAEHLGTQHTELYVAPSHALEIVPKLATWYDEPFADASQVPTAIVCELTREHVTVALSGDGGDELFAGYERYAHGQRLWNRIRRVPAVVRNAIAGAVGALPWGQGLGGVPAMRVARRIRNTAQAWRDSGALYRQLLTHWDDPESVVYGSREPRGELWNPEYEQRIPDFTERMQFLDTLTYLPDDILTKLDRASMAVSLEARVPLLDHRLVEFAWRLPMEHKLHGGRSKVLLRRVLERYVPAQLIERPKMGFGVPLDAWLRGPLRDWAESLLDERRLREQGLLNPQPVRAQWQSHLQGENRSYPLWDVLMLQAWLDQSPWRA